MSNRKIVVRVLAVIFVVALLAGAGYALYRYGYLRGVAAAEDGAVFFGRFPGGFWFRDDDLNDHVRDFFDRSGPMTFDFGSRDRVMRYDDNLNSLPLARFFSARAVFSPLSLLVRIVVCVFLLWVGYKIVTTIFGGRGWRLSFHQIPSEAESAEEESTSVKKGK